MEKTEVEEVVRTTVSATVPQAVKYTLEHYGFDVRHPMEVQRDQQWLRGARRFMNGIMTKILTLLALTLLGAAWFLYNTGLVKLGG